jgi:hypothetical protein
MPTNALGDPKGAKEIRPTDKGNHKPLDKERLDKQREEEEEALDKTIEDSFPASDPPSSIPDPHEDEDAA